MKRFVDLRPAEIACNRFAFWCTVRDEFERFAGSQAWETWAEFEADYDGADLERYRGLCPEWAFAPPPPEDDDIATFDYVVVRVPVAQATTTPQKPLT